MGKFFTILFVFLALGGIFWIGTQTMFKKVELGTLDTPYFSVLFPVPLDDNYKVFEWPYETETWEGQLKDGDFYKVAVLTYRPENADVTPDTASGFIDLLIEDSGYKDFGFVSEVVDRPLPCSENCNDWKNYDSVNIAYKDPESNSYHALNTLAQVFVYEEENRIYVFRIDVIATENPQERVDRFFSSIVIK